MSSRCFSCPYVRPPIVTSGSITSLRSGQDWKLERIFLKLSDKDPLKIKKRKLLIIKMSSTFTYQTSYWKHNCSQTSMARTSFGLWKFPLVMSRSSHKAIIAPGQNANGNDLAMPFQSSINNGMLGYTTESPRWGDFREYTQDTLLWWNNNIFLN